VAELASSVAGFGMPYGHQPIFYVGEVGPAAAVSRDIPISVRASSIVDHQGKLIGRFGETPAGIELANFSRRTDLLSTREAMSMSARSVDGLAADLSRHPRPDHIRSLQKFEKVG